MGGFSIVFCERFPGRVICVIPKLEICVAFEWVNGPFGYLYWDNDPPCHEGHAMLFGKVMAAIAL